LKLQLLALLRQHAMFAAWSLPRLSRTATICTLRTYHADEIVLAQGSPAEQLFIVMDGECVAHRAVEIKSTKRVPVRSVFNLFILFLSVLFTF
jgi:signal-transduction protein with cAMP-binding, CBS, and nucleotidyltransferase domain